MCPTGRGQTRTTERWGDGAAGWRRGGDNVGGNDDGDSRLHRALAPAPTPPPSSALASLLKAEGGGGGGGPTPLKRCLE